MSCHLLFGAVDESVDDLPMFERIESEPPAANSVTDSSKCFQQVIKRSV